MAGALSRREFLECVLAWALGAGLGGTGLAQQHGNPPAAEVIPYLHVRSVVDFTPRELVERVPELRKLEFADSQELLAGVLAKTGANVETFFRDFQNTGALEIVNHSREAPGNTAAEYSKKKYHYIITSPTDPDGLALEEYRTNLRNETVTTVEVEGAYLLTTGHASSPIYFHPRAQRGCAFKYFGRDKGALVVAFAQNPEIPQTTGFINLMGTEVLLLIQGVAWIHPESFQVMKMRLDLLKPRTDVGLEQHTTWVEFAQVPFENVSRAIWLPHEVRILIVWKGWKFSNRHGYSQYRLFSVESRDGDKKIISPRK